MSEYVVKSSDLTLIADAIRARGETSEPLVFPNGFVSAINSIPSGGSGGVEEITVSDSGSVSQALNAETIYHFVGSLTALTVTFNAPSNSQLAQYHFDFLSGSTAPTLTLPNVVIMPDGFSVEEDKRYEVDILNSYGVVMSWSNS